MDEPHSKRISSLEQLLSKNIAPVFWTPELLGKPSGWWGHVPFAFWLVDALKPKVVVELGTYRGISYSAFCEAVIRCGLETRCYAVDTWDGDAHVGLYGDDIYREFKDFHDKKYVEFSELIRMCFDDAAHKFADKTIDLLHIDGYHTYEAARNDFNTWLPKLSDRAVVLFHDTNNDLMDDIGVDRFFSEIKKNMPTFEFSHSFGLGVAGVGPDIPDAVKALFAISEDQEKLHAQQLFAQLGACWEKSDLLNQLREAGIYQKSLEAVLNNKDAVILNAQKAYDALSQSYSDKDAAFGVEQRACAELINSLKETLAAKESALHEAQTAYDALTDVVKKKEVELQSLRASLGKLMEQLQ